MTEGISEAISALSGLLVAGSAIAASVIGAIGLNTWRSARRFEGDYELAKVFLVELYKVHRTLNAVRYPVIWANEAELSSEETARFTELAQRSALHTAKVYMKRWDTHTAQMVALDALKLQALAVWGDSFADLMTDFDELERELFRVVRSKVESVHPGNDEEKREVYAGMLKAERDILYDTLDVEKDVFAKELQASLEDVMAYLRSKLSGAPQ